MKILDGKSLSQKISEDLEKEIISLEIKPRLLIIQVGEREDSNLYIKNKIAFSEKIGISVELKKFKEDCKEQELIQEIKSINEDDSVHGIIVQMPLPSNLNSLEILNSIDPQKDADGLSSQNIYKLINNQEDAILPATARGINSLLEFYKINLSGKKVLVIGRSLLTGKTIALSMLNQDATVSICHSKTLNLSEHTKNSDIIITATGQINLINDEHLKAGQIVIDVGINSLNGYFVGDTDLKNTEVLEAFSPVPGGIGPMTVVSLFQNLLDLYYRQIAKKS